MSQQFADPPHMADAARSTRHVFVRNLEMLAHIGVYGHEQGKPQPIRINLDMAVEDTAVVDDRLESVVDYAIMTERVRAVVNGGHIDLAETLAERIAAECLKEARVHRVRVRVEKLHAVNGAESAGVEIERLAAQA